MGETSREGDRVHQGTLRPTEVCVTSLLKWEAEAQGENRTELIL